MEQIQIQGASGAYLANVNKDNELIVRAACVPLIHQASLLGNAYSWTAVSADIDAGDTGLLVVNRSSEKWLVISRAYFRVDVESQVKIHCPAAATWAGTSVVGNNLNRKFSNNAPALAYADETGNVFAAANVIETIYCPNSVNSQVTTSIGVPVDFKDSIILGFNQSIAADIITEPGAFEATFVGYFIDEP
jgi:hypothetical protein